MNHIFQARRFLWSQKQPRLPHKTHNCPDDPSANPLKVFLPNKLYTPRQANEWSNCFLVPYSYPSCFYTSHVMYYRRFCFSCILWYIKLNNKKRTGYFRLSCCVTIYRNAANLPQAACSAYVGTKIAGTGFEPATPRVWTVCSSQLSYPAIISSGNWIWTSDTTGMNRVL